MRHATQLALAVADSRRWWLRGIPAGVRACDGLRIEDDSALDYDGAESLLAGERVDLPTCPACAVLLDEALSRR